MGRKDGKPRGRMSSYAFFVQTCREEHKKKCPDENVVFAEFTKKCAQKWKVSTIYFNMSSIVLNVCQWNVTSEYVLTSEQNEKLCLNK